MNARAAGRSSSNGLAAPAQLVDPDGSVRLEALSADAQVAWYSRIVHVGQGGLVEVVRATRQADGQLRMRSRRGPRHYLDAGDAYALCRLAGMARGRGEEVFCTPLPRERAEPGKRAVGMGSVVWVDLDGADGNGLREIGRLKPHLWVASGAGQHLYWRLAEELPPGEVEELNRRLCHRLDGDPACCEYGRIMRLPGTFNQRRGEWCRIVRADRSRAPVEPEAIRAALPDPDPPEPASRKGRPRHGSPMADDELQLIEPPVYFLALCGLRVPDGGGMVKCPLPDHEDAYASCQVYGDAEQGWWCFGCSRGGRIYDLASLMSGGAWGRELRGEAFRSVREMVAAAVR
jgi:RepB DNA-primase from phage plasmid